MIFEYTGCGKTIVEYWLKEDDFPESAWIKNVMYFVSEHMKDNTFVSMSAV
jgi:hypothetical protein